MTPLEYLSTKIPGRPITWARAASGNGRRHTPEPYRSWKANAAVEYQAAAKLRRFPPDSELAVLVDVWADRVEVSVSVLEAADRRRPANVTGDVDNYAKAALDALEAAGTIRNDVQVADLRVRFRREGSTP